MYQLAITAEELEQILLKQQHDISSVEISEINAGSSIISTTVDFTISDGSELKFKAPVAASQLVGLNINYPDESGNRASKDFIFYDANGNDISNVDDLFAADAVIKTILDVTNGKAFIQNADTNAYLENRFKALTDKLDSIESELSNLQIWTGGSY